MLCTWWTVSSWSVRTISITFILVLEILVASIVVAGLLCPGSIHRPEIYCSFLSLSWSLLLDQYTATKLWLYKVSLFLMNCQHCGTDFAEWSDLRSEWVEWTKWVQLCNCYCLIIQHSRCHFVITSFLLVEGHPEQPSFLTPELPSLNHQNHSLTCVQLVTSF